MIDKDLLRAREEFFSEAQELVDALGKSLLRLDEFVRTSREPEPDLVNEVFRIVHTLKGLSGLFGLAGMSGLSHELENVLDDLRMGRTELRPVLLDTFFDAVQLYITILNAARTSGEEPKGEVETLLATLAALSSSDGNERPGFVQYDLNAELLGVLTEYEEHRLRSNLDAGNSLFRINVRFPLAEIESGLESVKQRLKGLGEIITYLPMGDGGDIDSIALEVLFSGKVSQERLEETVYDDAEGLLPVISVEEVAKRDLSAVRTPPIEGRADGKSPRITMPPAPAVPRIEETSGQDTPGAPPYGARAQASAPEPRGDMAAIGAALAALPEELWAPLDRSIQGTLAPADLHPHRADAGAIRGLGDPRLPRGFGQNLQGAPEPTFEQMHTAPSLVPAPPEVTIRSVSQTVRVDIRKLDHLMNVLGELALVRGALSRVTERLRDVPGQRPLARELLHMGRTFERHLYQMQHSILEVRMVPLGQVFDKLARAVRQVAREESKSVQLVVTGAETEIDKLIVEELSDPLLHVIRNAIDHGIEGPGDRAILGKPESGTIAINAYQQGNHVLIEIEDDGRGIDPARIVARALARGLVSPDEVKDITPHDAMQLIMMPGFTTRDEATALSGRGMGLDIVKTRMARLGGIVDVTSDLQIGSKITITLPVTLAIVGVLIFRVEGLSYCMPLSNIEEALAWPAQSADGGGGRVVDGREVIVHRGHTLPIVRLRSLFRLRGQGPTKPALIVARVGTRRLGFVVDDLVGQEQIVVKSFGPSLSHVRGFAGATDLGDHRVALVLDVPALLEDFLTTGDLRRASERPSLTGGAS